VRTPSPLPKEPEQLIDRHVIANGIQQAMHQWKDRPLVDLLQAKVFASRLAARLTLTDTR
jgi:hypothetical protein